MKLLHVILVLLVIAGEGPIAWPQSSRAGAIAGTIRYLGEVPPSQRILTSDGATIVHNDIVVHPKSKGLRDVVAVLEWKEKIPADAKAKPVVVDQREMVFVPRLVTAREGQTVRFDNSDMCNHIVQSASIHAENLFNRTSPYEHKFKAQKNPIPIGCPLHPWMRAWVMVLPHPYHAVSDAQGKFRIEQVPAGKHTLLLIHPDTNYRETVHVEVQPGKTAEIALDWSKLKK
jgi:plastocyanin